MKRKGQISIGIGIAIAILFFILIFYVFPTTQEKVIFQIQLQEQKILEGSDTILFYRVTNNLNEKIEEVEKEFQIVGENWLPSKTKGIEFINKNDFENGAFEVPSSSLDSGEYILKLDLSYYVPSKQETLTETLTLKLEIIEKPN